MNKNEIKLEARDAADTKHTTTELIPIRCESVWCESSGDFTLPDYMPKIGKMLSCTPRIIPTGRYIGSERAEFSGSVVYSVLYTGEDGAPFWTTLSGDYEYAIPLGDAQDSARVEIYDEPIIENVSMRASGPRKMSVRTRIRSTPCIMFERTTDTQDQLPDDASLERLTEIIPVSFHRHFESGEFTICENFKLDASPEAEAVGCDGVVCVTEVTPFAGAVVCRGEVECRVLYFDIEGGRRKLLCTKKKMRFEERISVPELAEQSGLRVYGRLISTDLAAAEDSSDVSVSAVVGLYGEYTGTEERPFLLDVYSCEHPCAVNFENTEYRRAVLCRNANYSFHTQKSLPDNFLSECDLCTSVAVSRIEEVTVSDGSVEVSGEITVECVVCRNGDDGSEYAVLSMPIPVKCEFPAEYSAKKYETSVMCDVVDIRTRIDGENVCADAELYMAVFVNGVESVNTVKSTYPTDGSVPHGEAITVYYPDKEETLWSVSKKFAVPLKTVAAKNGIKSASPDYADSLEGVGLLII